MSWIDCQPFFAWTGGRLRAGAGEDEGSSLTSDLMRELGGRGSGRIRTGRIAVPWMAGLEMFIQA